MVRDKNIHILITDVKMPEMDGMTLMREALAIKPHLIVIVITGYRDLKDAVTTIQEGAFHYLTKPFTPKELTDTVQRAVQEILKREADKEERMPTRIIQREQPTVATKEPAWMHHYRRHLPHPSCRHRSHPSLCCPRAGRRYGRGSPTITSWPPGLCRASAPGSPSRRGSTSTPAACPRLPLA